MVGLLLQVGRWHMRAQIQLSALTTTAAAAATATAATTSSLLQQPLPKGQRSQLFSPARHVRRDRRGTARSGEGAIRGYGI